MTKRRKIKKGTCSICQMPFVGTGNSAWPINDGTCCDDCVEYVLSAKLNQYLRGRANKSQVIR